jgi:uncharacterized protein YbjT (DUF2867 family)
MKKSKNTALVIGATGLVGSFVVKELLQDESFSEVKIFVRKKTPLHHPKLKQIVVNFDDISTFSNELKGDVLYSCMGTTIKTAGSKEAQFKVDYTYQNNVAVAAKNNGVSVYALVSSTGASSNSMVFYSKMKGQLEDAIKKLDFEKLVIVRPSVLIGDRPEKRLGESLSVPFISMVSKIIPSVKKYRGIHGKEVAKSMINLSKMDKNGPVQVELDELFDYLG